MQKKSSKWSGVLLITLWELMKDNHVD